MKCPRCDRDWLWSWCHDTFRQTDGPDCLRLIGYDASLDQQFLVLACQCGCYLGDDYKDGSIANGPEEWKGIDWELSGNCYEGEGPHD